MLSKQQMQVIEKLQGMPPSEIQRSLRTSAQFEKSEELKLRYEMLSASFADYFQGRSCSVTDAIRQHSEAKAQLYAAWFDSFLYFYNLVQAAWKHIDKELDSYGFESPGSPGMALLKAIELDCKGEIEIVSLGCWEVSPRKQYEHYRKVNKLRREGISIPAELVKKGVDSLGPMKPFHEFMSSCKLIAQSAGKNDQRIKGRVREFQEKQETLVSLIAAMGRPSKSKRGWTYINGVKLKNGPNGKPPSLSQAINKT